jgi:arsenate reductase (thioredoxin)
MARKPRILFVCQNDSIRSQMAEGFVRFYAGNRLDVESAGETPLPLDSYASWAMHETGVDITHQSPTALETKRLDQFDYIVTLCPEAEQAISNPPERATLKRWNIPTPSKVRGQSSDRITAYRIIRYHIERHVQELLRELLGQPG